MCLLKQYPEKMSMFVNDQDDSDSKKVRIGRWQPKFVIGNGGSMFWQKSFDEQWLIGNFDELFLYFDCWWLLCVCVLLFWVFLTIFGYVCKSTFIEEYGLLVVLDTFICIKRCVFIFHKQHYPAFYVPSRHGNKYLNLIFSRN